MAVARRTIVLEARYLRDARALGIVGGSDASRAVARVVAQLAAADVLPEPIDVTTLVEPDAPGVSALAHVRRVLGRNLWIWYLPRNGELALVALTSAPPESA
jgi:hypothetical protein